LLGLLQSDSGAIYLNQQDVSHLPVDTRRELGLGFIPADRQLQGLVLSFSLKENLVLGRQREHARYGLFSWKRIEQWAQDRLGEFQIHPPDPNCSAHTLSGGNQQRVILAREMSRPGLKVLIGAHPTRGMDIAAAQLVHQKLLYLAERGVSVLVISSDLDELRTICHRIGVMVRGKIVDSFPATEATDEHLGALMTSAKGGALG
jgi:simple sugar transport system ATP-binding protein